MTDRRNIIFISSTLVIGLVLIFFFYFNKHSDSQDLRFASLLPFQGQVAGMGEMMRNGQTLAVEKINSKINSSDPKLDVIFFDTAHKKDVALDRLKEAHRSGINFVCEIFGSDQAENCFDYAIKSNMFLLSGVDTRPDLVEKGKGYFFRIMPNDAAASEFLVKRANELKLSRLAILYANDDWGNGLRDGAIASAAKMNIPIVDIRDISRGQTSYSAVVAQLKNSQPDGIFLFVYPDDGGRFLKEASRQNLKSNFFATENFTGDEMINSAKSAALGVMLAVPAPEEKNPAFLEFKSLFLKRFGKEPNIFAIKGYDAVMMLYKINILSKNDPAKARQIAKNITLNGISGQLSFDKTGEFVPGEYSRLRFEMVNNVIKPIEVQR